MRTRIVRCERHTCHEGDGSERVLFYKLDIGRLGRFFGPEAMPPFEGGSGFVEVMGPNTRLTVLRQVEAHTPTREATEDERRAIYAYRKAI